MSIACVNFRKFDKGVLRGSGSLEMEKWGIVIHDCTLCEKNGKWWVNTPQKIYEKDGEKKYANYISFKKEDHYKTFQSLAAAAMKKKYDETEKEFKPAEASDEEIPF